MKIKAIFFDLDGTLLPMHMETFVNAYLGGLINLLAPKGYEPEAIERALWASIRAMIKNDGSKTNEQAFWDSFCSILGDGIRNEEDALAEFYATDFQEIKNVCGFAPEAREIIDRLHEASIPLVLATSPLFPRVATESRMRWAGLSTEDFITVTTYEDCRYAKPNPKYYEELLKKTNLSASDCVMIGNDVGDDMVAEELGFRVFLLTECLINRKDVDISKYRHGDYSALKEFIEELIDE